VVKYKKVLDFHTEKNSNPKTFAVNFVDKYILTVYELYFYKYIIHALTIAETLINN